MPTLRTAALLTGGLLLALTACAAPPAPTPAPRPAPDDVIKAATQLLTDDCLTRQHLTPPRPGRSSLPQPQQLRVSDALFGTGRAQLAVRLPTGYVVRTHTDGCLAAANQRLYGDGARWFRTSVIVNNLRPEAAHARLPLAEIRARHHAELADWRRMRTHALTVSLNLLAKDHDHSPSKGTPTP
ncbi:hypothetical protein [Streptomyces sp. NPDC101776]|uniref:hypothetical protein n=1 Tax=Streptomyces sp. NPDC101776 TaxID=3366146 RepID=UPI00380B5CCA